jgi:hypothetical protein
MSEAKEFTALRRRKRYLEQELYTYDKYLRNHPEDVTAQTRMALDAQDFNDELNEIEFMLRYFDRIGTGYHLSKVDWLFLIGIAFLATALAVVAVMR